LFILFFFFFVYILFCGCFDLFGDVGVCGWVGGGFVMCGCFDNCVCVLVM